MRIRAELLQAVPGTRAAMVRRMKQESLESIEADRLEAISGGFRLITAIMSIPYRYPGQAPQRPTDPPRWAQPIAPLP